MFMVQRLGVISEHNLTSRSKLFNCENITWEKIERENLDNFKTEREAILFHCTKENFIIPIIDYLFRV